MGTFTKIHQMETPWDCETGSDRRLPFPISNFSYTLALKSV